MIRCSQLEQAVTRYQEPHWGVIGYIFVLKRAASGTARFSTPGRILEGHWMSLFSSVWQRLSVRLRTF